MAKKDYPAGMDFYKKKHLKPVVSYLTREVHEALIKMAAKEGRSLQKQVQRLLEEAVHNH